MPLLHFFRRFVVILDSLLREVLFQLRYIDDVGICGIDSFSSSSRICEGLEENGNGRNAASISEHLDHLPYGLKAVAVYGNVIRSGLHISEFEIADGIGVDTVDHLLGRSLEPHLDTLIDVLAARKHQLASNAVLDTLPLLTELTKRGGAQKENARQNDADSSDHGV